jgi:hypothetical protein
MKLCYSPNILLKEVPFMAQVGYGLAVLILLWWALPKIIKRLFDGMGAAAVPRTKCCG